MICTLGLKQSEKAKSKNKDHDNKDGLDSDQIQVIYMDIVIFYHKNYRSRNLSRAYLKKNLSQSKIYYFQKLVEYKTYRIPDIWKGISDITIAHVPDFGYEGV